MEAHERFEETAGDPVRKILEAELRSRREDTEREDAAARETYERRRAEHAEERGRAADETRGMERIEAERLLGMRRHRRNLDSEATAAQDVALRALAGLGLPFDPGRTSPDDLLVPPTLPRGEAARRARVPAARVVEDPLLKWLKYAGLVGCLLLGTFGLGALLLRVPPRSLPTSPLLPLALGLGCSLVGGAYLAVVPAARRHGARSAAAPEAPETRRSLIGLAALVAGTAVTVALVDAKALAALDGARALVDPASVPPFGTTLLVAAALSATYVAGSAMLGYAEGFSEESEAMVESERASFAEDWREGRRADPDVRQAMEAVGYAGTVEARRRQLGGEIESAESELRRTLREAMAAAGPPPAEDDGKGAERREREARARLAELRLAAHERHAAPWDGRNGGGA